jgi:CRP/FNR family transcriptional regulator
LGELREAAIANALRHCRLFESIEPALLRRIAAITTPKFVAKGALLFVAGAALRGFFIVQTGAIKLYRVNGEGKEQLLHVFRAGESLGEETLGSETGYPADACALEDSVVFVVQKAGFVELLRHSPELALCLLRTAAHHLDDLMNQVTDLKLHDVQTRLARWLMADHPQQSATPNGRERRSIELSMTKRVLAAELGTRSETLSRTLAKLARQGLLAVHGRRLTLLSPLRLAGLANGPAPHGLVPQAVG